MRCKYCNKSLKPTEYRWDEERGEFLETCGGRCLISKEDKDDLDDYNEDDDGAEVDDDGIINNVQQWVPEGK